MKAALKASTVLNFKFKTLIESIINLNLSFHLRVIIFVQI